MRINKFQETVISSTILTMVLAMIFLGEKITVLKVISIVLIGIGTYLMIEKKEDKKQAKGNKIWYNRTNDWFTLCYCNGSNYTRSTTSTYEFRNF